MVSAKGGYYFSTPTKHFCDCAAHDNSNGYFDFCNIPPWDTWFMYEKLQDDRHVLYSYVPLEFVDLAIRGVSVNIRSSAFSGWIQMCLYQSKDTHSSRITSNLDLFQPTQHP